MSRKLIPLASISLNPANPRVIEDKAFKALKASIQKDPEILTVRPLVVHSKENLQLLAGEQRYKALLDLGHTEIPSTWIIYADSLSDEQKRKFILLDNHHSGTWDISKLNEDWDLDQLQDWNIEIPGLITEIEMPELLATGTAPEKIRKTPSATDDEYSVFEIVMLHPNKLELLETLNKIKNENSFEKLEESLMFLVRITNPKP